MYSYICAHCKIEYDFVDEEEWSEEDVKNECKEIWGVEAQPDDPVVCDDCFNKIKSFYGKV